MKERVLVILLGIIGLACVYYGMIRDNNWIFIVGILFVIVGYLKIRKKLKASRDPSESRRDLQQGFKDSK